MTLQEVLSTFQSTYPTNNPLCDGSHCTSPTGLIRIIPLDDSVNVHLCSSCYAEELSFNEQRELEGLDRVLPDLPFHIYPLLSPEKVQSNQQ